MKKKYYFTGIGGSGMSPLAQVLRQRGHWVAGSDRSFDRKLNRTFFEKLQAQGIRLLPQHRASVTGDLDFLVVSTAIESGNPELQKARELSVPVLHRAELLSQLFNCSRGIGIAGTSGKSTVTGMTASVLDAAGLDPAVVNGGIIVQYAAGDRIGNAKSGGSDFMVSEVDESDGSIIRFYPEVGVVLNISKDHKPVSELKELFETFAGHTSGTLVLNGDSPELKAINARRVVRFGLGDGHDIGAKHLERGRTGQSFLVGQGTFCIRVPGRHNVYNALAAVAVGRVLGVPDAAIQKGLIAFQGIRRRLEPVGAKKGIVVFDDFAHNPDKIKASIEALRPMSRRVIVLFQPHGYGPTRFLLEDLGSAFSEALRPEDWLLCLPIYDAGGTADRSISADDLLNAVKGPGRLGVPDRREALARVKGLAAPGDAVVVMGARDDTLSDFAREIFDLF